MNTTYADSRGHEMCCTFSISIMSWLKPSLQFSFLEAKASKGIQPGLYWKITWPPFIHTSALKIVPLVVRVYTVDFVKCFDIAVFCFICNQSGQFILNQRKITIFYLFKFILQSFKLSLLTGLSELWLIFALVALEGSTLWQNFHGYGKEST